MHFLPYRSLSLYISSERILPPIINALHVMLWVNWASWASQGVTLPVHIFQLLLAVCVGIVPVLVLYPAVVACLCWYCRLVLYRYYWLSVLQLKWIPWIVWGIQSQIAGSAVSAEIERQHVVKVFLCGTCADLL